MRHLDAGPATVFGSSGGAVTALAMLQAHPEQVDRIIAHEPPLEELLDDREHRRAATDQMIATYLSDGPAAAWAIFLAEANIPTMTVPRTTARPVARSRPVQRWCAGRVAWKRDPQDVADERHFFTHELRPTTLWQPDLAPCDRGSIASSSASGRTRQVRSAI